MWLSECATLCANCHLHVSDCLAPSHNSRMASWNRKCTVGIFFTEANSDLQLSVKLEIIGCDDLLTERWWKSGLWNWSAKFTLNCTHHWLPLALVTRMFLVLCHELLIKLLNCSVRVLWAARFISLCCLYCLFKVQNSKSKPLHSRTVIILLAVVGFVHIFHTCNSVLN